MDRSEKNDRAIAWLAAAVFCESLQCLIILGVISHHAPVDTSYFMTRAFDKVKEGFFLTRQVLLYRIFGVLNVLLAYCSWRLFRNRLDDAHFVRGLKWYVWLNFLLIAWQVTGVFQIVTEHSAPWAWGILYAGIGMALITRLFWKEVLHLCQSRSLGQTLGQQRWIIDAFLLAAITAVLMWLTRGHVPAGVKVSLYMAVLYTGLRVWGVNPLIAAIGIYCAVKWIFIYAGMGAAFRMDAALLLLMALYYRQKQWRYMLGAALLTGLMLVWEPLYALPQIVMIMVFTAPGIFGESKNRFKAKLCWTLPWLVWLAALQCGWSDTKIVLALARQVIAAFQGTDNVPWYTPLFSRHFFIFTAGLAVPLFYLFFILVTGARTALLKTMARHWLAVAWAVYGLLCYGAYAYLSVPRMYYFISLPLVVLGCYTVQTCYERLRRPAALGDPQHMTVNLGLASWMVVVQIVQAVIYIRQAFGYSPVHEPAVYTWGIAAAVTAQAVWVIRWRDRWAKPELMRPWFGFIAMETLLVTFQLCALWQMFIYSPRSQLAQNVLAVLIVMSVVNKVFWPQVRRLGAAIMRCVLNPVWTGPLRFWADAACVLFIAALIYVPDPQAALAKMFMGEHFHHYDMMVMEPAFACHMGNLLYIDTFTTYGFGMPLIIARLAEGLGGFSDLTVFNIIVVLSILSFIFFYVFLRYWIGSIILSLAAVLIGIKWQMFYSFAYPMTFTYANSTALRFGTDVLFLAAMIMHIRTHRQIFLWLAALSAGFAVFFIVSTGLDLIFAFWAYLTLHLVSRQWRPYVMRSTSQWWQTGLIYAAPLVSGFAFYAWVAGKYAFGRLFWHNMSEAQRLFLDGFVFSAYFNGWRHAKYLDDWMGLVLPAVELGTIIYVIIKVLQNRGRQEHFFLLIMAVYGYSMYMHFAALCVGNNYYMRALPFVFLCFYWIKRGIDRLPVVWQRRAPLAVLGLTAFALLTNHNYISHPNMFCISRNPMVDPLVAEPLPEDGRPYFFHQEAGILEEFLRPVNSLGEKDQGFVFEYQFPDDETLKAYYRKEADFSGEGAFIASLTSPGERVPLLSSWDWRILQAADRKPFFYAVPFFENRPLRARSFSTATMYHKDFLKRELERMEKLKPEMVFVQRMYLDPDVPARYFYKTNNEPLMLLLQYIRQHYEPFREGVYLVAMKRKL
ncbi:MAG: hypothetical protein Q7K71_05970 [Candidatus Omnitrophota bacterium]|nr:hypothetical protein [Candidatus Omnitrophota bacterium]